MSQRQWQRDQTIARIQEAALPLLAERGYAATTAEHLADAAGVSVRTLFRYFPSGKDDVIVGELRRALDALEYAIRSRPRSETLFEALEAAGADYYSHEQAIDLIDSARLTANVARDHPALMARLLGERQLLAERLVDEVARRLGLDPDTELRPRLVAHCYVASLVAGYLTGLHRPDQDSRAIIAAALAAIRPLFE